MLSGLRAYSNILKSEGGMSREYDRMNKYCDMTGTTNDNCSAVRYVHPVPNSINMSILLS